MKEETFRQKAEKMYRKKNYSCAMYMCVVATTCYSAKERKKICVDCLTKRLMEEEKERNKWKNISSQLMFTDFMMK